MNEDGKKIQIRNSTVDFLVFTKQNTEDGIEVWVQDVSSPAYYSLCREKVLSIQINRLKPHL